MIDFIEISWDQQTFKLNLFWLRDHCRCDSCYDHENHQRKLSLNDIPDDISIENVKEFLLNDKDELEIDCELCI